MKKPQALIGLLAALGTAIGVLIAVVGLPYGRADYTAFAELYHGTVDNTGLAHMAVDCEVSTAGTQDGSVGTDCQYPALTAGTADVDVTLANDTGSTFKLGSFNFRLNSTSAARFTAPVGVSCGAPAFGCNPDFNGDAINDAADTIPAPDITGGGWSCTPPTPDNDTGLGPVGGEQAFISCANGAGDGPDLASDGGITHTTLARVHYNIPLAGPAGVSLLALANVNVFDDSITEQISCNPVVTTAGNCFGAELELVPPADTSTPAPATSTPTLAPTNTPVPTNTPAPTNTPPAGVAIQKISEWCDAGEPPTTNADCQADPPTANLFICEAPALCLGQGEGNLIVFEYAFNVLAGEDENNDAGDDGLGAYEFSVEYDNLVIASVNPCDVVFGPNSGPDTNGADLTIDGEGAARGDVLEDTAPAANPYCGNPAAYNGASTCTMSVVLENVVHFGCVTEGQDPDGPTGNMDIAALNLIPHGDLRDDLFPGNDNGVVTILKDNGCELVTPLGHPLLATQGTGGIVTDCGNLAVTVRILEGDIDLDCDVDSADAQAIATRYGGFFGSLLYSKWFDLEPNLHDLDIDIKDVQKVFGRIGSDCQDPEPDQTPVPFN